jgi:hypothetical protein
MSNLRILMATLLVVGLLLLPAIAVAQPSVCGFYGSVTLNGASVDNGTMVKAFIDGEEVSDTNTTSGSQYFIKVAGKYSGKTVVFTVGPDDAPAETALWEAGENISLDLNGIPSTAPPELPDASIELNPAEGLVTQVSGEGFIPNSSVTVTVGGEQAVTVTAGADGSFVTVLVSPIQQAGTYTVVAAGVTDRSAEAVFTVPDLRGEPGADGAEGAQGPEGQKGDADGMGMAVAALIIAIIAAILAVLIAVRVSSRWKR